MKDHSLTQYAFATLAWGGFCLLLNSMSHDAMLYSGVAILLACSWLAALAQT